MAWNKKESYYATPTKQAITKQAIIASRVGYMYE
jgi:hypothetical protein